MPRVVTGTFQADDMTTRVARSQAVSFYAILPDVWPKRNSLELRPEVAIANSGQDKGILVNGVKTAITPSGFIP